MSYHSGNNLIDPSIIFEKAHLHEGMHIADFGCGRTGHIVFTGSKIVGDRGIVYAIDILKDVLDAIIARAEIEFINNIETVWADLEKRNSLSIVPKTLDVAFFINVLYHFKDSEISLSEAARILKEKSRIVIVDWSKKLSGLGPTENEFVDFTKIKNWAEKNNFVVQEEFDLGNYHHGIILFRN
ncbi:MAG: methyltransferase domain-containing protein [Patescibacteria group bacterium]